MHRKEGRKSVVTTFFCTWKMNIIIDRFNFYVDFSYASRSLRLTKVKSVPCKILDIIRVWNSRLQYLELTAMWLCYHVVLLGGNDGNAIYFFSSFLYLRWPELIFSRFPGLFGKKPSWLMSMPLWGSLGQVKLGWSPVCCRWNEAEAASLHLGVGYPYCLGFKRVGAWFPSVASSPFNRVTHAQLLLQH